MRRFLTRGFWFPLFCLALPVLALSQPEPGAGSEWATYGGTLDNQRYSRLSQINRRNVRDLRVAWTFHTGFQQEKASFECTPLVVDGTLYLTSPRDEVFALKADTGKLLWKYDPKVILFLKLCCGFANRGVAVANDRVYLATLDARLIALDKKTGKPIPAFGKQGIVKIAESGQGYSETSAPILCDGKILLGVAGGEFTTRGFFSAYDAETGELLWRWHTIPAPDEPGGDTWPNTEVYKIGGGNPWMPPAVDKERGLVIFGTGNPNPDFDGRARTGDNLYTCCIVALDLATGKRRWHFQEVKHDLWDYDQASPPLLFDVTRNGKRIPAVGAAGKTGWFYILDRETGRSLLPIREIAVGQNERHATAKTQTVLTVPPFTEQRNLFAPLTSDGVQITPGLSGGSEWSPVSYSPQTGLAYVSAVNLPMIYTTEPKQKHFLELPPFNLILGGGFAVPVDRMATGAFVAIDVNTGLVKWRAPVTPHPVGGTIATAGGLVFASESNGLFTALDARTGKRLWQYRCNAGVNAAPMTYAINGRQYVAVAVGGNAKEGTTSGLAGQKYFARGDTLTVFALPR